MASEALLAEKLKSGISNQDLPALKENGVDFAKLAAGLAAAMVGADVGTASYTEDNAARHNSGDSVPDFLFVMCDAGKIGYGYYKGDKGLIKEG